MIWIWLGFFAIIATLLALDLGVLNRKAHVIRTREALAWTLVWVGCAAVFNVLIYFMYEYHIMGIGTEPGHATSGSQAALQFLTGYIIEESLSLDNIFVMALVFSYFGVEAKYQHRVLFWGILGAIVLRITMILAGVALIRRFEWMILVFGGFLVITALKLLFSGGDENVHPEKNLLVRIAKRFFPVTSGYREMHFFVREHGRLYMTPMFLVLLTIESLDVVFAVDSIPAIFGVTQDPFIVFTSNVFAILGLRSLYFALAAILRQFRYLKVSLVIVLAFVGMKMLLSPLFHIPIGISLGVIVLVLGGGVVASILVPEQAKTKGE